MNQEQIAQAARIISAARYAVALTGAGISRPSGIPDFRSAGGLWAQEDPLEVASFSTFRTNPERFFNWLRPLLQVSLAARPNPAHLALAELEQKGILHAVITQNIDGLHQRAGSRVVYELHGHMRSATCTRCERQIEADRLVEQVLMGIMPRCDCGQHGMLKPDIVLFDEILPIVPFQRAQQALATCDVLLIVGTSLEVYPVAHLPLTALQHGARLVIINLDATYVDGYADVSIHADVATVLPAILNHADFRHYE